MPVFKFKTHEEAQKSLWNFDPGKDYYEKIRGLFQLAFRLSPPRSKRGIHAYKTLEESAEAAAEFREKG